MPETPSRSRPWVLSIDMEAAIAFPGAAFGAKEGWAANDRVGRTDRFLRGGTRQRHHHAVRLRTVMADRAGAPTGVSPTVGRRALGR